MTKVQILENENFIKYADFENCEVWLLNRLSTKPLDERVINIQELTETISNSSTKFPLLMSYIDEKHPPIEKRDENDNLIDVEVGFDYEVITDNKENYSIHTYVCNVDKIKIV